MQLIGQAERRPAVSVYSQWPFNKFFIGAGVYVVLTGVHWFTCLRLIFLFTITFSAAGKGYYIYFQADLVHGSFAYFQLLSQLKSGLFAVIPITQYFSKFSHPLASRVALCITFLMMSGRNTFNSKFPDAPPRVTATSLPNT